MTLLSGRGINAIQRKLLPVAEPMLSEREMEYVTDALRRGDISSMGPYVARFESAFAAFCESPHAVSCSNGTVALHLALLGLDIGPGDEVIVPALTFISTANAVVHAGAKPVFADIHPAHWGFDPESVAARITARTKAIIAVHLYGHPADLDPLRDLASKRGIRLIEDAAEAHGARYKGRRVGSIGDIGTFSFYGNKIITTGEGGMLTTADPAIAAKLRLYKNHGADPNRRYWHPVVGYNYRMTNLQAALGLAQVERAEELLEARKGIGQAYRERLSGLPLELQPALPWAQPVCWLVCVVLRCDAPISAKELQDRLRSLGIDSRPFFIPIPTLPPYDSGELFPVAMSLSRRGINLPSSPRLSPDDISRVADAVRSLLS